MTEGEEAAEMYFRQGDTAEDWDFTEDRKKACNFAVYEQAVDCVKRLHPIVENAMSFSRSLGGYTPDKIKISVVGYIDPGRTQQ